MGPKTPHSTVLSSKEEAIIVAFRKHTLLPLTAAEQRQVAQRLTAAHAAMALWRACRHGVCRRRRRCCGDVNSCGARRSPKAWAWVHEVLGAIRSGTARRAAVRAADRRARPERVKVKFGFGDPPFVMLEKKDDGTWGRIADYPPPSPVELQLRPVRGRGSRWLREAGQGVGAGRSPVPARASVGER